MYDAPFYRGSGKLQDRVALITGGDSGIGRAVAILFAREGADVAIVHLKDEESDACVTREGVLGGGTEMHPDRRRRFSPELLQESSSADGQRASVLSIYS